MVAAIRPSAQAPASIEASLASFADASAEQLAERALLRRVDSKFVVRRSELAGLIGELGSAYTALRVRTGSCATYRSLYLDTPDLVCFHDHRRGRRVRHKIRIRHYQDRALSFLEVKTKRNEQITNKHRMEVPFTRSASATAS